VTSCAGSCSCRVFISGIHLLHVSSYLSGSLILDGYRLIRFLGRGGFGEVWLCQSESIGDFRVLKFIPDTDSDRLDKEFQALLHYRKAAARLRSPNLLPIEHVNRNDAGLYYVMPLADGTGADEPADPAWQPTSLASMIHERSGMPSWFYSREIISLLLPVLEALQTLSDAGLVHRDVKPENILLFGGQPCLGDISLLGADASVITRRGTPGYGTPSWYVGGHPDMYGVAATLFTLLTGNLPDRMGRAAFLWPPQGESSMSSEEQAEWKRLHAVIRRATEENVGERFVDFRAMAKAMSTDQPLSGSENKRPKRVAMTMSLVLIACVVGVWVVTRSMNDLPPQSAPSAVEPLPTASVPSAVLKTTEVPLSAPATTKRLDDAYLAHSALSAAQDGFYNPDRHGDPEDDASMTNDENELYQNMLVQIHNSVWGGSEPDFTAAVQFLNACLNTVPRVKKRPNVQLAHLLLHQCADDRATNLAVLDDPSFLTLGNDDLGYRVALLSRLGAESKADEFLGNFITQESRTPGEKSEALVRRARVRATLGRFGEAQADADQSLALVGDNPALKARRESDIMRMGSDIPAFADYLKSHTEK
jgi:serine/threonine protein kinase